MSQPINFDGSNLIMHAPAGAENVKDMHVFQTRHSCVSCWTVAGDELAEINATGKIFLSVLMGGQQPPVYVGSESTCRAVMVDFGPVWPMAPRPAPQSAMLTIQEKETLDCVMEIAREIVGAINFNDLEEDGTNVDEQCVYKIEGALERLSTLPDLPGGSDAVMDKAEHALRRLLTGDPTPPPSTHMTLSPAASDVLSERHRQVSSEGWTVEHDDTHASEELATAASCYLRPDLRTVDVSADRVTFEDPWPWWNEWNDGGRCAGREKAWWKPSDRRRDLVKAAALIIAEIERLDRAALATTEGQPDGR